MNGPWENYDDGDTAVADGPWNAYEEEQAPTSSAPLPAPVFTDEDQAYARSILRPPEGTIRGDHAPSWWQQFRSGPTGHKLFGPTDIEREAAGSGSALIPGGGVGVLPLASTMLKFSSVPPPIANEVRTVTDPFLETPLIGDVGQGVAKGIREIALTTPIAPLPAAGTALGKGLLGAFAGEFAANLPEAKRAYDEAVDRGDTVEAAKIAAETVGGGLLIGAGAAHGLRGKPSTTKEPNALRERISETLPVGETSENSGEVGTGVPIPEEPAGTQGGEQSLAQPAEAAPGEISLRPAIQAQGQIVPGIAGKSHSDILADATKANDPIKLMAAFAGFNEGRGFVDQDGKFYTRKEAEAILREQHGDFDLIKPTEGLHSEDLNSEGKPKTIKKVEATPEPPKGGTYPISEFKGEFPSSAPHFPVLIERADGSRYEAFLNGYYDMPGTSFDGVPSIGKVKPSGPTGELSLSHGILDPSEKIVGGDYPKNAAEYKAAKESGVQPPRTLGESPLDTFGNRFKTEQDQRVSQLRQIWPELDEKTAGKLVTGADFDIARRKYEALSPEKQAAIDEWFGKLDDEDKGGLITAKEVASMADRLKPLLDDVARNADAIGARLSDAVRRAAQWPEMSKAIGVLFHGVMDAATKQGADLEGVRSAIERDVRAKFGADAPEMLKHYFGEKSDPIIKALDKAIDRLGIDPSQSFSDPFFVQSVGKPVARAALIAARAAYKTSKDVGQAIGAGLRNLHAAGVRFNATLTQVHAQQWLHSMLTAPKPSGASRAIGNLNRKRQAIGTLFRSEGNRKLMDQTFDAMENMANIAGEQMRNRLNIGTKPIEREAALAVIEANGDIAKLNLFEQQAKAGDHAGAEKAVNYARANWGALQPLADRMKRIMDQQVADEHTNGITTEYHEAYVPHIYDKDLWMGSGRPFVVGTGGGGGASTGFKKGRSFPTIFDAIEAGYHPQTLDIGKLAEHRVKNGQKLINLKQWGEMLSVVHDPTDGKSIVTALVRKSRGPGQPGYEVAPVGYTPREIIPGVRVAIHEGYSSLFDAMTGTSRISGNAVGQLLLQTEGALKHGLLLFDTFHASRIIQKQLMLTGRLDAGARGHTLLEYSNTDLGRAVAAKLITPEMAQWVRANRPTANLLIRSGLNVGRVSEALYTSFVREIPGLGTFNKWVFEKLTRGALLQAGLIEFDRVSKAMPGLSPQQVALKVSRDLNAYFGNLGRQGLFKSGTGQDLARLVFLAPNWVESMARTETKGALQIAKGVTVDPIVHKTLLTGTIGKGVAQGLLAYFIGTQLLNMITRGQPTWQNPEDKHKLDAWIPDLSGKKGPGFFISPFSVVAELTHDMIRYAQSEGTALKAMAKIGGNKLSPPARALKILTTGRDFDKTHIDSTWGRVKAAGMALAPAPIPLAPVMKGTQYPGQTQRQLTASMGFKTEPAESASQQVSEKARDFITKQGKGHPFDFEPTEDPSYAKLRAILRRGDDTEAMGMLQELRKNHTGKQVLTAMRNHVRSPFTGSKARERAFIGSLNPQESEMYDKARGEQRAEYENFLKLWYSRQGAPATTNEQPAAASAPWLGY